MKDSLPSTILSGKQSGTSEGGAVVSIPVPEGVVDLTPKEYIGIGEMPTVAVLTPRLCT